MKPQEGLEHLGSRTDNFIHVSSRNRVEHGNTEADVRRKDHYFYMVMSFAISICVFAGFAKTYYLRSYFPEPDLHLVTEIHGLINTCWILLFVVQNTLIATGRLGLHRRLGWSCTFFAHRACWNSNRRRCSPSGPRQPCTRYLRVPPDLLVSKHTCIRSTDGCCHLLQAKCPGS